MQPIESIALEDIMAARERIVGIALRTPLVRLNVDDGSAEIYLKLENLQPIGSFKIRGAGNALACCDPGQLAEGVFTVSAGNMAQGLAYAARELSVACSVIVPEHAPKTKLDAITRLGGSILTVPFDEWWSIIVTHETDRVHGSFIHPVSRPEVIAGNGTIGLEILDDLPEVDAVVIPFGGGGLSGGIGSAIKAMKPDTRLFAAEVETAAPLHASFEAHEPCTVAHTPSFVDGIGGRSVLAEMWPLVSRVVDGSIVVSLKQIAEAIRLLVMRNRVVAEGAGAASLAAAMRAQIPDARRIVCVISGGNIDADTLATILNGEIPT